MWIGARLAAVEITEGLGASMTLVYRATWSGDTMVRYAGAADMHRAAVGRNNWVRLRFPSVGLCRKNQAESKSNFGGRCPVTRHIDTFLRNMGKKAQQMTDTFRAECYQKLPANDCADNRFRCLHDALLDRWASRRS